MSKTMWQNPTCGKPLVTFVDIINAYYPIREHFQYTFLLRRKKLQLCLWKVWRWYILWRYVLQPYEPSSFFLLQANRLPLRCLGLLLVCDEHFCPTSGSLFVGEWICSLVNSMSIAYKWYIINDTEPNIKFCRLSFLSFCEDLWKMMSIKYL